MKLNQKLVDACRMSEAACCLGQEPHSVTCEDEISDEVVLQSRLVGHQDMAHLLEQIYRVDDKSAEMKRLST
jgi:hypothetical protein